MVENSTSDPVYLQGVLPMQVVLNQVTGVDKDPLKADEQVVTLRILRATCRIEMTVDSGGRNSSLRNIFTGADNDTITLDTVERSLATGQCYNLASLFSAILIEACTIHHPR